MSGTTYNGAIVLLNETVDPAENITEEVEEESDEHQFFYTAGSGLDLTTTYTNFDEDGNPLEQPFSLTARASSSGTLSFTLRHEPTKPNSGLSDAGGETDIVTTFKVAIGIALSVSQRFKPASLVNYTMRSGFFYSYNLFI